MQLVFPLSAAAALIATLPLLDSFGDWLAWLTGLIFLGALLLAYVQQNRTHLGRAVHDARTSCLKTVRRLRGR